MPRPPDARVTDRDGRSPGRRRARGGARRAGRGARVGRHGCPQVPRARSAPGAVRLAWGAWGGDPGDDAGDLPGGGAPGHRDGEAPHEAGGGSHVVGALAYGTATAMVLGLQAVACAVVAAVCLVCALGARMTGEPVLVVVACAAAAAFWALAALRGRLPRLAGSRGPLWAVGLTRAALTVVVEERRRRTWTAEELRAARARQEAAVQAKRRVRRGVLLASSCATAALTGTTALLHPHALGGISIVVLATTALIATVCALVLRRPAAAPRR